MWDARPQDEFDSTLQLEKIDRANASSFEPLEAGMQYLGPAVHRFVSKGHGQTANLRDNSTGYLYPLDKSLGVSLRAYAKGSFDITEALDNSDGGFAVAPLVGIQPLSVRNSR